MSKQKMLFKWGALSCLLLPFSAEAQDYTQGFRYQDRLMISPYVNLEAIFDSNIIYAHDAAGDWIYRLNPGADFFFKGNEWGIVGNVWYAHSWHQKYDEKDEHRFGQRLSAFRESSKGWIVSVGQGYTESDQNDSRTLDGGDGIWRNRVYFDAFGTLSYAFNPKLSAGLTVSFADMWYANKGEKYQVLHGWKQWALGGEVSYALSTRSRFAVIGSYQEYYTGAKNMTFGNLSRNYSLQGGFMSGLTERIRYRALIGASLYDYGGEMSAAPSYTLDASWKISSKLALTAAGAGYFQPSETSFYQKKTIYTLSGGVTYRPIKKVTLTGDAIYRGEDNQTVDKYSSSVADYSRNQYTLRARVSYSLHRYASIYTSAEYTYQDSNRLHEQQWDRYRMSVGLSLRY
ncbi:MAG: hypothetical protein FWH21_02040 [Kiritimatiellaeota bacterium]|nr:hypothetical protein [Kiritimatiellota bacterium]